MDEKVVVPITEDAAYTVGTEQGQAKIGEQLVGIDWRVTNIYRREAGGWKMVHHHTDVRRWRKPSACRRAKKGVLEGWSVAAPALLLALIHPSAWKGEFSEVPGGALPSLCLSPP